VRRLHGWSPAKVSKLYSFRPLFPAISPNQGEDFIYITSTNSDYLLVVEWTVFRQDLTSKFRPARSTWPFRRVLPVSRTWPSTIHGVRIDWYPSNQHRLLWMPSSPSVKNGANPSPGVVSGYFHSTADEQSAHNSVNSSQYLNKNRRAFPPLTK
jgi:hypothetical protein